MTTIRKAPLATVAVPFAVALLLISACQTATPGPVPTAVESAPASTATEAVVATATAVPPTATATVAATVTPTPYVPGVLEPVARNATWILGGWEYTAQFAGADSFNPYTNPPSLRTNYAKFVYEALMYTNLTTGEEIPWLAESYVVDADYAGMTIYLREGTAWSDGRPVTCADVEYSIEVVRDTDAAVHHAFFREWVDEVGCADDLTVRIDYTGPNPRFYQSIMVGHENHFVIVPKHIFESQDVATFANLDLAAGLPIGSGAYELVLVTPQQIVYDRRDDWWGAQIGFRALPAPERIVVTTAGSESVLAEQYQVNNIDYGGFGLSRDAFETARARNPNLRSWFPSGPVYGAPDGCVYQLALNNAKYSDPNVRSAINYAIDRQALVDGAFQGTTRPRVLPVSGYVWDLWESALSPVVEKYNRGASSRTLVDSHMAQAGYRTNRDGRWEKDGEVVTISMVAPQPWASLGPVLVEQLTAAGFEADQRMDAGNRWVPMHMTGELDAVAFVHCGSLHDPHDTMVQFHSKSYVPVGEMGDGGGSLFTYHRYPGDPQMDLVLDEMAKTAPDPLDPGYAGWVATVAEIYLRDMPTIVLAEELYVVAMNETYWTGYPTSENPYLAPYPCWNDFSVVPFVIQPVQ